MDHRLVSSQARSRRVEGLLHSGQPARGTGGRELRPATAEHQDPAQCDQGRLASVCAELLPPLPPGRAPCTAGGYVDEPCRFSLRDQGEERAMSNRDNGNETGRKERVLNRRNILLGGTTLAAASAFGAGASLQVAQAQAQQPAPSGRRPNILVIFGDDIGQTNVSAYSFGLMGYRTPNIDRIAREGMMFTDYYAEQSCTAGRPRSSPARRPCAPGCPRSACRP